MRTQSLTACETEVMNVVWSQHDVTVHDVVDAMPRELAYTTVMTMLNILEDKGFVERGEKRGRAYVYRPIVSSETVSRFTLRDTANRFFDGSVKLLVLSLIRTNQITSDDLAELRDAIDSFEASK
jgi:predicted transcriptional regulator